jgi:general secretion pathway protein H
MPSGRPSGQQGFTLIELLAVLVVLTLVAGLVATSFSTRQSGEVLQATVYELASHLRAARMVAIRQATERTVVIDVDTRTVTAGKDIAPLSIADTIGFSLQSSAGEQQTATSTGIRFFPNGGSTGGKIRLETGRQAYEVRVNWLTGRVAVERVP